MRHWVRLVPQAVESKKLLIGYAQVLPYVMFIFNLSPFIDVLPDWYTVLQPVVCELALELAHGLAQDGDKDSLLAD